MREVTRRRLLADMGIPVWHVRIPQPQAGSVEPAALTPAAPPEPISAQPTERSPAPATPPPAPRMKAEPESTAPHAVRSAAGEAGAAAEAVAAGAAGAAAEARAVADADASASADRRVAEPPGHQPPPISQEPWSVLSLAAGGVVMLVSGDRSRRDLRLARDILSAATGDWRSRPASRRFDWPPNVPGDSAPPSADAGQRALTAFVDKDLEDHGAAMLLCEAPVSGRLPDAGTRRRIEFPRLEDLARDTGAKRQLWRTLREARS